MEEIIEKKEETETTEEVKENPNIDLEALRPFLTEIIKEEARVFFSEIMLAKPEEKNEEKEEIEKDEEAEYSEF